MQTRLYAVLNRIKNRVLYVEPLDKDAQRANQAQAEQNYVQQATKKGIPEAHAKAVFEKMMEEHAYADQTGRRILSPTSNVADLLRMPGQNGRLPGSEGDSDVALGFDLIQGQGRAGHGSVANLHRMLGELKDNLSGHGMRYGRGF